jgi:hypothetical protein
VGKKKSAARFSADLAGQYGVEVLKLDYEVQFGLWLQLRRLKTRRVAEMAEAINMALSTQDVDFEVADALAYHEVEASEILFVINSALQRARLKSKLNYPEE